MEATFDPKTNLTQAPAMLKALLAERFKLALHTQKLPARVYELRTDGPIKLKPHVEGTPAEGSPCPQEYGGYGVARFWGAGPIAKLADLLSSNFKLPVLDKTGLKGNYVFSFCYVEPGSSPDVAPPAPTSIEKAVREQLGFMLVPQRGEITEYIVSHVEMPTPN